MMMMMTSACLHSRCYGYCCYREDAGLVCAKEPEQSDHCTEEGKHVIDTNSFFVEKETDAHTDTPGAIPDGASAAGDREKPTPPDVLSVEPGATDITFDVAKDKLPPGNAVSASPEAIEYMASVGLEDLLLCVFNESLQTVSASGEELGLFTVAVQPAHYPQQGLEEEKCFLVHASTQGIIDDVPCGTSIVAYISQKLETLEQHHHEYMKIKGHSVDKKTHMRRQGSEIIINTVITEGEKVRREITSHPLSSLQGFVSEASNLLIMRIMAKRKIVPDMVFVTFDAETNLCASSYCELGSRVQMIGRDAAEVYGIERIIRSEDIPITWQCYFLTDGHLASRVQIGSPVLVQLALMPVLIEAEQPDPKPVFEKKPLIWEEDMQLYSNFLDRKEEFIADYETYLRRHPEVQLLLADFMQFLLMRKPDDIITFAAEFFGPFSTNQERGESFQSSKIPNPFQNR
ncbi:ciliogenesis-associated TTC17-interacting protein [Pelodytes ibericus]